MRLKTTLFAASLLVAGPAFVRATTLSSFIIVSAVNPQVQHGTFDNGNTYSGNFVFDTSSIPATGPFSIPIPSFNVITYMPGGFVEAAPGFSDFATLTGTPVQIGGHTFSYDVLAIDGGFIEFDFIEPLGVFHGGAILYAFEADGGAGIADTKGTALLVDPLILSPEPGAAVPMLGAVFLLAGIGRHRRRALRKSETPAELKPLGS